MPRTITPGSSLDDCKREAKRWLKALHADDGEARARLVRAYPDAPPQPTLRDVQHALARELGFAGWTALKNRAVHAAEEKPLDDALVARFLDNACPDHHVRGGPDHVRASHTAMRLLAHNPEIARASFQTRVVCGDLSGVAHALARDAALASLSDSTPGGERSGSGGSGDLMTKDLGPKGWEPLLYLCFTRLPLDSVRENAIAIARTLLDHGANPNAFFMAGGSRYTPLVGAIGEGEENRPPHPEREALVRLLLERGAQPYDSQVIYNIHFHGEVLWFLELIYAHAVRMGELRPWNDPEWSMLDMGGYGTGARWHLSLAIEHGDVALARWCLVHGANPNAPPPRSKNLPKETLFEQAVKLGQVEIAELLVQYGALRSDVRLSPLDELIAASMRLDMNAVRAVLAREPALIAAPEPLRLAARRDRVDVAAALLDLGMSPNVETATGERPLHAAAYENSLTVARLLLDRGAEIDPVEKSWGNTPLGAAVYAQHREMIDLLAPRSRDLWELTYAGKVDRVRTLLTEVAENGRIAGGGHTPLMWLPPDDEAVAIEIAHLYLAHGADATLRNNDGMTAADRADRLGMFALAELLRGAEHAPPGPALIARMERLAVNLEEAYRTGSPEAMRRHWSDTWHTRNWETMRRYVQLDLGRRAAAGDEPPFTLDDARLLVAREQGYENYKVLVAVLSALPPGRPQPTTKPLKLFGSTTSSKTNTAERTRDWDVAIDALRDGRASGLDAAGQMTDDLLERVSHLSTVTSLRIGGSPALTDKGIAHLARMPQLRELDIGGCAISDPAFAVLRALPALETLELWQTGITDAGAVHLAACDRLERVNLGGTGTGDGALRALCGKERLRHFRGGNGVTDAGMPLLHDFPIFKKWKGGDVALALLSAEAEPNSLMLRGTFTDRGLAALAGLDGLFALNVDDSSLPITAAGLAPLVSLPHLGFLGFDATDEAMSYIAAMPALRFLLCQDTRAGDDGFVALSQSQSIEYIWGRRCHNLQDRGFAALSAMPALRALSVSCKNVSDAGLSSLPAFPALAELMPMDVPDHGYQYVGRCLGLESLVLMYCRETTDAATEQIAQLPRLASYFASYTGITDRTPELLSRMTTLERITLAGCAGVSNTGIVALAKLPRLRELRLSGMQNVTSESVTAFSSRVEVDYSP